MVVCMVLSIFFVVVVKCNQIGLINAWKKIINGKTKLCFFLDYFFKLLPKQEKCICMILKINNILYVLYVIKKKKHLIL